MSVQRRIEEFLTIQTQNHDYLPLRLAIDDQDIGLVQFVKSLNLSIPDKTGNIVPVPIVFVHQEKWAEFRNNYKILKDEGGKEITMPFMAIRRTGIKKSVDPLNRVTIPVKRLFPYTKVPIIENGVERGFEYYDIPQSPRIDITYELFFASHYIMDVNLSYEAMLANSFNEGNVYIRINGHDVSITLGEPSEENTVEDIQEDNHYKIVYPLTLHGKIVDPTKFRKIKSITKIRLDIK